MIPISFSQYIVIICFIIILITLYITINQKYKFSKFGIGISFLMLIEIITLMLTISLKGKYKVMLFYSPTFIFFGALLFFHIQFLLEKKITTKKIILHSIPVFIIIVGYTLTSVFYDPKYLFIYILLYYINFSSILGYGIYAIFVPYPLEMNRKLKDALLLIGIIFSLAGSILIVATSLFVYKNDNFEKIVDYHESELIFNIFYILFCWQYLRICIDISTSKIVLPYQKIKTKEQYKNEPSTAIDVLYYQKSNLSAKILNDYAEKLMHVMEKEQLYLNRDLSLDDLEKLLKIPKHHLSQLFSSHFGKSFYQYINTFRIEYACQLIDQEKSISISDLAHRSGFNNNVSFNRYFKEQIGMTPSLYKKNIS